MYCSCDDDTILQIVTRVVYCKSWYNVDCKFIGEVVWIIYCCAFTHAAKLTRPRVYTKLFACLCQYSITTYKVCHNDNASQLTNKQAMHRLIIYSEKRASKNGTGVISKNSIKPNSSVAFFRVISVIKRGVMQSV